MAISRSGTEKEQDDLRISYCVRKPRNVGDMSKDAEASLKGLPIAKSGEI